MLVGGHASGGHASGGLGICNIASVDQTLKQKMAN